jgi:hypothetical protein
VTIITIFCSCLATIVEANGTIKGYTKTNVSYGRKKYGRTY